MQNEIPVNKWKRSISGGKTALKVGGKVLKYFAEKPFLRSGEKEKARKRTRLESASALFSGLSLLKGTALKIAQQLSFEIEMFPDEIRCELEKSYHQVPPLNRALIRKVIKNELGEAPERLFTHFEPNAFAAASLGQVHRAESLDGIPLAVKVQYPGIDQTITSDIRLIKTILRPSSDFHIYESALDEIKDRLMEEIDYQREAEALTFFKKNLKIPNMTIPDVYKASVTRHILPQTYLKGLPLDQWMKTKPSQKQRDKVANTLNEIFLTGLYELNSIHADPNPGNFIIGEDQRVGVVDFGCVKKLKTSFVKNYGKLPSTITHPDKKEYFKLLKDLNIIKPDLDTEIKEKLYETMSRFSQWFGKLYKEERFDFGANPGFFVEGRSHWDELYKLRKYVDMNPNFIFLDRTRYGLMRIFEKLGARVRIRNRFEWQ